MSKINQINDLLKENSNDYFLWYALALEKVKINAFEEALILFEKIMSEKPDYLATYYQYGQLLANLNQNEKAAQVFEKGIAVASSQQNMKTRQELEQALFLLD